MRYLSILSFSSFQIAIFFSCSSFFLKASPCQDNKNNFSQLTVKTKNLMQKSRIKLFFKAAKKGDKETIFNLLVDGVNPNHLNKNQETVLHQIAFYGHKECLALLVGASADINAKDMYGDTPLHNAASSNYDSCVKELIDLGADTSLKNRDGETAFDVAKNCSLNGSHEKCMRLLKAINNMLVFTARSGDLEGVKEALSLGATLDFRNAMGRTALWEASEHNFLLCVDYLLTQGAEVDSIDYLGETALHRAALHGFSSIVQRLLISRADPSLPDSCCDTALHNAVIKKNSCCLSFLLSAGADLFFINLEGETPLSLAQKYSNEPCYKPIIELIEKGY